MSFRLHTELVRAPGAEAERWALVLHGVFGSGANWRLFMRQLAARCPSWGFVLVDLRGHGRSLGAPPPHDLNAAAGDLLALGEQELGGPIRGVIGHSLGGKVALAYAARRAGELDQVWTLDSRPGVEPEPRSTPTVRVLETLEALPPRFETRDEFIATVEQQGIDRGVANWLAMSLRRGADDYQLGLDLPAIRALLDDYFRLDLWPEIERSDPRRQLHVVVAGRSFVWRDDDRERLDAIAATEPRVHVHVLPNAGHWVHVDAADELMARLADALRP